MINYIRHRKVQFNGGYGNITGKDSKYFIFLILLIEIGVSIVII